MMPEDELLLNKYIKAVTIPRMNTDNVKYPIRDSRVNHIFLKEYTEEFISDFNELKNKEIFYKDFGKMFRNPSRLMRMIHLFNKGMQILEYPKEKRQEIVLELLKIIQTQKFGDIFNENKKNIILDDKTLKELLSNVDFIKTNNGKSILIQKLCGILWSYSEVPYFVAHDIGIEEHGLYEFDSSKVMIREFFNLKPTELWKSCEKLPFDEIKIISKYNKNFNLNLDVFNNLYFDSGNSIQDLEEFYVEADGKQIDEEEIKNLIEICSQIIQEISIEVENMDEKTLAKKYADIYWYRKKPLRDALEKGWRPSKEIYDLIDSGEIKPDRKKNLTPQQIEEEMDLT